VVRAYPLDGLPWLYLGLAKHSQRKYKEAVQAYRRAKELHTKVASWFPDYAMAQAYVPLGDKENAVRALEAALAVFNAFPQQLYDKGWLAPLRDEPRFKQLTGRADKENAPRLSRVEGWKKDVDLLVAHVRKVNPELRGRELPPAFAERYRRLRRDVPGLSDDQIYVGILHMVAALRQGHTGIFPTEKGKVTRGVLPLDLYLFPEGVFVVAADGANKGLVGCEVVKLEDEPATKLVDRLAGYATVEGPVEVLTQSMLSIRRLAVLRGLGVVKPGKDEVRLTLRGKDGKDLERTLKAVPPPESFNNKLAPPPAVKPPLFLRDMKRAHWFKRLPGADAVYAQLNQMVDSPDETLPAFGLKLRKFLNETGVKNVILDVRHNNGGTTQLYPELLRTLIAHTAKDGNRLYVIIGRAVYSACANLVTDLERLAKPTFVGEPTSGTGNQHGDSSYYFLPYSGLGAQLSSALWQLSTPFDRRRSLVPDIPVQLTAKDWREGRDPALEAVLRDMRRPPRPAVPDLP
jgi:hypothetical protein